MITQPAKVFLPLVGLGTVAAIVYAVATGDHTGVSLWLGLAIVALGGTLAVSSARDTDVPAPVAADAPPPEIRPIGPVRLVGGPGWPAIAGLGVAMIAGAMILTPLLFAAGVGLILVASVGWLSSVSIDRTRRVPNLMPVGIPVVGLFSVASMMFFMSRILLAVPEQASTFIALAVAVLVMATASFIAAKPHLSPRTLFTALLVGGLVMAGGGTVAGLVGQRDVEEHEQAEAVELAAHQVKFTLEEIHLGADQESVIDFKNEDTVPHNVAIYQDSNYSGLALFQGAVITGGSKTAYHFKAPGAGTYYFRCDIHPTMTGKVTVA